MTKEELKQKAEEVANRFIQITGYEDRVMVKRISEAVQYGFDKGVTENGIQWHDLRKDPNDLPKVVKEYITNIGVMTFDRLKDRHLWTTPLCDACDYYEEVTDEVIAWCEIPQFKE